VEVLGLGTIKFAAKQEIYTNWVFFLPRIDFFLNTGFFWDFLRDRLEMIEKKVKLSNLLIFSSRIRTQATPNFEPLPSKHSI
jgi:hypothetical protein